MYINKQEITLRKLCKILLRKARKNFSRKKNKKKIEYIRLQKAKKFSSIFYKNSKKKSLRVLLSNVYVKNFRLPEKKGIKIKIKEKKLLRPRNLRYNKKVSKKNKESFKLLKKKKKLPKRKKVKSISFYKRFKKELIIDQPLTRFYRVNLELLAINYNLLLNFHVAIGNSYKNWINPGVFSSILAIRNDMILYDLSMIFIKLKKGLQMIFQISKHRGSILGFVDINRNYKFSGSGFDHFLRSWLAGYLTNFKYVIKNLIALKTKKFLSLTRRQRKFFGNLVQKKEVSVKYYYRFFDIKKEYRKEGIPEQKKKKIPAIPQFGFSLEDHSIWLNESHRIGNNVMCICDSGGFPQQVDFPLIANQKSLPFNFFLVKIVTEAIIGGKRLDFYSFIGFQNVAKYLR